MVPRRESLRTLFTPLAVTYGEPGLGFLGVAIDESRNADRAAGDDREITVHGYAQVRTFVMGAREDKQIAAEVRSILA